MRELYSIGYLSISDIGPALAEQLQSIYPDNQNAPSGFATQLHTKDDPKFWAVVELLNRAGLQARYGLESFDPKKEFRINAIREYDYPDLDACELLYLDLLHPKRGVSSVSRSPHGYAVMDIRGIPEDPTSSIHETPDAYVVSDSAKRLLESAGLRHLAFKPALVTARGSSVGPFISWEAAGHEPWWEITSEQWMPCLSPATELWRTSDERPMTEIERRTLDYGRGVYPVERPFRTPELHYSRKDIQEWSTFCDIARTYEPFGRPEADRRLLVVSQRFYRFCRFHAIKAEWVPVRVDEQ